MSQSKGRRYALYEVDGFKVDLHQAVSNLTTAQLCGKAKVSPQTLSKMRNGGAVSMRTLVKISNALGCTIDSIIKK